MRSTSTACPQCGAEGFWYEIPEGIACEKCGTKFPKKSPWQPIETAPTNLDIILVSCPKMGVTTAKWEKYAKPGFWNYDVWDIYPSRDSECWPTKWMPMPEDV